MGRSESFGRLLEKPLIVAGDTVRNSRLLDMAGYSSTGSPYKESAAF